MAVIHHITTTTSRFNSAGNAFGPPNAADDSPGADTLIVDPNAFLVAGGASGDGAFLANTGAWTVTVNGSIVSQSAVGIHLVSVSFSAINIGTQGEVEGAIGILLEGPAKLNNAGEISSSTGPAIQLANAPHVIINSGRIVGDIIGSGAADTMTDFAIVGDVMKSGTVIGTINLEGGNDTFIAGANSETVEDGIGADTYKLGGSSDTYIATGSFGGLDENDTVRGGAGIDTYDASAASGAVFINLDAVAHDLTPFNPGMGLVAANTATGTDISGTAKDAIFGFENATGGDGIDIIYGSTPRNVLVGGGDADALFGFGGNDTLDGGPGVDGLVGGPGKDELIGGPDSDFFRYTKLSDSGITPATRDLIADFEPGVDKINLLLIDANKTNAAGTNDAFNFIGNNTPFTVGAAGQLHAFFSAIGQIVEGDVNGDAKPDFSIEINDPTHAITLISASFVL
jgi:Ca2+-binding RTX toxin-like protein